MRASKFLYIIFSIIVTLLLMSSFIKTGVEKYMMYICGFTILVGLLLLFVAFLRVALKKVL